VTVGQKAAKLTPAQERAAYAAATRRDDDTCQRCLRNCGPTARDHRQNRQAGNTIPENLQVLGLRCHIWKTEHPAAAIADGWAVSAWADPRKWPARRWVRGEHNIMHLSWVLYHGTRYEVISDARAHQIMEGTD